MTALTDEQRARLVEVMARAIADANHGTLIWEVYVDDARTALAAIEAAGWRLVPPEEEDKT